MNQGVAASTPLNRARLGGLQRREHLVGRERHRPEPDPDRVVDRVRDRRRHPRRRWLRRPETARTIQMRRLLGKRIERLEEAAGIVTRHCRKPCIACLIVVQGTKHHARGLRWSVSSANFGGHPQRFRATRALTGTRSRGADATTSRSIRSAADERYVAHWLSFHAYLPPGPHSQSGTAPARTLICEKLLSAQ